MVIRWLLYTHLEQVCNVFCCITSKIYFLGTLEPYFKSEAVPEPNDGPVKIAVAKNFQALVTDSTKDVLVEFYAPW